MRFCELPISADLESRVPGSVFSWGGYQGLVRVGKYRAVGPHPSQEWIFQGDEIVQVKDSRRQRDWV
jgi:hypothetical protein